MIRRPPRSTPLYSSAASDVYKRQALHHFSIAKEINTGLFEDCEDSRQFHSFILMMLGKCFIEQQSFSQASEQLGKALQFNEQQAGADHISNVNVLTDLAFVNTKKNNYENALALYSRAIEIVEHTLGPQSETLASLYLDIAKVFEALSDLNKAIEFQRRALEILRNIEAVDHIVLANICISLAEWCSRTQQHEAAVDAISGSVKAYEEAYGKQDPNTCRAREKLAGILHRAGKLEPAIEELKRVEETREQLEGFMNVKVGKLCKKLATWLREAKREEEAKRYTKRAASILASNKRQTTNLTMDNISDNENNEFRPSKVATNSAKKTSTQKNIKKVKRVVMRLSLIHICRCRRSTLCRSRWSPYH
eukprot:TRINITY_DN9694_c0_g1_i19.p1 TRINITY_DN9694_c0_g1~~TRINITY_DN9694_c0_g1_i19.p1  ORF type:complete len:373 (-),score=120.89 TRINITY_DN9694_c0_g1_i19:25-1119(-)